MAGKQLATKIKLVIGAGQAKPAPPVGPALGQAGLNIMGFCKEFNAKTADVQDGTPIPVSINAYTDRSFDFTMRSPPVTYFLKRAAGLAKGAHKPGHEVAGYVSLKHVHAIAEVKRQDPGLRHLPLRSICSQIVATAKSMGIEVVPRPEDAPEGGRGGGGGER